MLVVDDSHLQRWRASRAVASLGFEPHAVASGAEAVAAALAEPFRLVLLDCNLPDLDGPQVARAIRSGEAGRGLRTPILAVTASGAEAERERCRAAGMDGFLLKPLGAASLREALAGRPPSGAEGAPELDWAGLPLVDRERFREFCEFALDEPWVAAELVGDYLRESPARLSQLLGLAARGDAEAVRAAAHTLRGSLAALGGLRAAAVAGLVEERAVDAGPPSADLRALLSALADTCAATDAALEQRRRALLDRAD